MPLGHGVTGTALAGQFDHLSRCHEAEPLRKVTRSTVDVRAAGFLDMATGFADQKRNTFA